MQMNSTWTFGADGCRFELGTIPTIQAAPYARAAVAVKRLTREFKGVPVSPLKAGAVRSAFTPFSKDQTEFQAHPLLAFRMNRRNSHVA
jgi:hypothetical protein